MSKAISLIAGFLVAIAFPALQASAESSPLVVSQQAQQTSESVTFFELMWLNEDGGGIEAAQEYFQKIGPIVERYGVTFNASYQAVEATSGYLQPPDFIFGFTFPSPEVAEQFNRDPEYAQLIPTRNEIFNFDDKIQFRVEPFGG